MLLTSCLVKRRVAPSPILPSPQVMTGEEVEPLPLSSSVICTFSALSEAKHSKVFRQRPLSRIQVEQPPPHPAAIGVPRGKPPTGQTAAYCNVIRLVESNTRR